nr:PREDICTED: probable cation-transporting ATPase 13A5 isoform X2 [Bemisia tabaci]
MCTGSNTVPVDCGKSRNRNGDRASSDKVLWAEENNYINYGEEDQMEVYGYASSFIRKMSIWILMCLTCGIVRLVFHWWPEWMLYATHRRCPLNEAEKILVINNYEGHIISHFVKDVKLISIHDLSSDSTKDKDRISGLDIQALVQLQSNLRSKKLKAFLFDGSRKAREFPKINSLRNLDRYVFLKLHVIWHSESIMVSTKIRISVFHQAGRNYETG